MNIVFLKEKRDECLTKLQSRIVTVFLQGFLAIYDKVKSKNKRPRELLKEYQYAIREISQWTSEDIKREHDRCRSQCELFDNLVRSIFKLHLAIYNITHECNFDAVIPQPGQYMHEVYLNIARRLWKEPFLVYDIKVDKITYQSNMLRFEKIIKKFIADTFLQMLPFKEFEAETIGPAETEGKAAADSEAAASAEAEAEADVEAEDPQSEGEAPPDAFGAANADNTHLEPTEASQIVAPLAATTLSDQDEEALADAVANQESEIEEYEGEGKVPPNGDTEADEEYESDGETFDAESDDGQDANMEEVDDAMAKVDGKAPPNSDAGDVMEVEEAPTCDPPSGDSGATDDTNPTNNEIIVQLLPNTEELEADSEDTQSEDTVPPEAGPVKVVHINTHQTPAKRRHQPTLSETKRLVKEKVRQRGYVDFASHPDSFF